MEVLHPYGWFLQIKELFMGFHECATSSDRTEASLISVRKTY